MGANTHLSPTRAKTLLEARGRESMVAGFYHVGYEDPLLMVLRRRTVHEGTKMEDGVGHHHGCSRAPMRRGCPFCSLTSSTEPLVRLLIIERKYFVDTCTTKEEIGYLKHALETLQGQEP